MVVTIGFKKLHPEAILPTVSHPGEDVGMDLYALEDTFIPAKGSAIVPVGIAADIPHGYWMRIENRSGMGFKYGLQVHPGIIDPSFLGELGVKMFNHTDKDVTIEAKQRFAQLVLYEAFFPEIEETFELPKTTRGTNGFGSTGKF